MFYVYDTGASYAFRWTCADSATWQAILHDLKASLPHHTGRRYDPTTRLWHMPYHSTSRLARWADAWFSDAAQQWDAGETETDASYGHTGGCGRDSHTTTQANTLDAAYRRLHLLPTAPPELVTAAYRIAAQQHHPDRGGTTTAMPAINDAVQTIRRHHERIAS